MDLASLYLRGFLGAKPFISQEMDSLAGRMSVVQRLSADNEDRYFLTGAKGVTAVTLGNKVVFGRKYYEKLSAQERLAAGAHEFAHVLDQDNKKLRITASNMAVSFALTLATLVAFHNILLTESVFCILFLASMWVSSSRDAGKEQGPGAQMRRHRCLVRRS